jgi:hypothetical protein
MMPTLWLLCCAIVVIQLSAEEAEPLPQIQDTVIHIITRASLDKENPLVREVLGKTGCDNTSCRTSTDNHIVIPFGVRDGKLCSSHFQDKCTVAKKPGETRAGRNSLPKQLASR